ncbi:hypothetical protein MKW92_003229 [Papaver armeniacum]|nr:hypothetical protein MKW92_003229 [Papaver armeniacum]
MIHLDVLYHTALTVYKISSLTSSSLRILRLRLSNNKIAKQRLPTKPSSAINNPQLQAFNTSSKQQQLNAMISFTTVIPSSSSTSDLYLTRNRPIFRYHQRAFRCSASVSASPSSNQIQFDLKTYWKTLITEINQKLDEAIPVKYPDQIYESMRYSVLDKAAKRAPPIMFIASAELFGVPRRAAFPTACALEMVHAASLIHDDLPYMDDDFTRRGRPTNHAIYGEDMAILAGDALFPLGFQHIVTYTPTDIIPESRILRVISEFARAVGSTGMAAGQFLDLTNGDKNLEFVQEKKFGEMAECSAACGGLLAGADDEEVARLRRYGRTVGVLYQMVDDVLKAKEMKGEGKKNREKMSYVSVNGIDKALEMIEELKTKAKKELDGFDKYGYEKVAPLYSFVDYAVHRGFVVVDNQDDVSDAREAASL